MNEYLTVHTIPDSKEIWEIAEEWTHELILKETERDFYLDPDYELAQQQLAFDFMECIDIQ